MAVEINGEIIKHEKPSRYNQLVLEHKQKVEQLKALQEEVDDIAGILTTLDAALIVRSVGNYGNYTTRDENGPYEIQPLPDITP